MQFPNASKGITKIFYSEILNLIADVAAGVMLVILFVYNRSFLSIQDSALNKPVTAVLVLGAVAAVLNLIALVIMMVGTVQAAGDEISFKRVVFLTILNLVLTAIASFFSADTYIHNSITVIGQLVSLVCSLLIILGIARMATKLHNDAVIRKCAGMFKIVLGLGALALVMRLFTIFMAAFAAQEATVSFSAFSLLLNVVQFSVYLPLLSAAKKMLAQAV